MDPLISVIIPMYNSEKYISRCLESVIKQTYSNLEIIIIDDGSTDNSYAICENLKKVDDRIFIIHQNNLGVSAARNVGLSIVKGKYVTFIDSDDFVYDNYIYDLFCSIEATKCQVAISRYTFNTNYKPHKIIKEYKIFNQKRAIINMLLGHYFDSSICCKMIDISLLDKFVFREDLSIAEDMLFIYEILGRCQNVVYVDNIGYCYDRRGGGAISKVTQSNINSMMIFEELIKQCCDKNILQALISKYISTSFHLLSFKNINNVDVEKLELAIKKYRHNVIFGKYVTSKVRVASLLSYVSLPLTLKIITCI